MQRPGFRWRSAAPLVARPDPEVRERRLAAGLLGVTGLSVALAYRAGVGGPWTDPGALGRALVFAGALLGILGVHELGHRLVAARHGMRVSWPLFLPAPFFVGTLGAVIRIDDRPRNRTALLEMGAAGPLAGFLAIGAVIGLRLALGSPGDVGEPLTRPLVWWVLGAALTGEVPPLGTADPLGYAAWVGCLITAMNLLPFGQLDGGHVWTALRPELGAATSWGVTVGLGLGGLAWSGWWWWALLLWALGARHPLPVHGPEDQAPSVRGRALAGGCAVAFLACFTPVPW